MPEWENKLTICLMWENRLKGVRNKSFKERVAHFFNMRNFNVYSIRLLPWTLCHFSGFIKIFGKISLLSCAIQTGAIPWLKSFACLFRFIILKRIHFPWAPRTRKWNQDEFLFSKAVLNMSGATWHLNSRSGMGRRPWRRSIASSSLTALPLNSTDAKS